ncbi:MAG: DUF711 family protein [Anaerolineae bacterium]|nr:DUF711 family protein [Anaerolineae bacterium]
MNIRSVTAFADMHYPLDEEPLLEICHVVSSCRDALTSAGFAVQTTRLATQPFPAILEGSKIRQAIPLARMLETIAHDVCFDYVALGPIRLDDPVEYIKAIPDILNETETVFVCLEIANRSGGIDLKRNLLAANVIRQVAYLQEDGFANLRLAALANVGPWFPYFPTAYHGGGAPRIALAIEGADLAIMAFREAATLRDARVQLIWSIESLAARMEEIVCQSLKHSTLLFQGIDFTLAPYPEDARSIGAALEYLGLPAFGTPGSLMVSAFLTDTLDRARFTRTGFCGLMLPVLEDTRLAARAAENTLRVSDLLACSAVCGTGLDTIPLPGDIDEGKLAAVLMDVAALALRLDKPLTARLMPLPGKQAGDPVTFDFEYFADSRVMTIDGDGVAGLLQHDQNIDIQSLLGRQQTSRS